jgi:hypothetical protein
MACLSLLTGAKSPVDTGAALSEIKEPARKTIHDLRQINTRAGSVAYERPSQRAGEAGR